MHAYLMLKNKRSPTSHACIGYSAVGGRSIYNGLVNYSVPISMYFEHLAIALHIDVADFSWGCDAKIVGKRMRQSHVVMYVHCILHTAYS